MRRAGEEKGSEGCKDQGPGKEPGQTLGVSEKWLVL